jgi:hypothetical protein
MLVHCLYASRAAQPLTSSLLDSILQQSSKNNPKVGITGLLCLTNDVFVQIIEGGRDEVNELFMAISRDSRHRDIRLLAFEEISQRRFGNWTMGQVDIDNINKALILKHSEKAELNPFGCSGRATMALLDDLVATGSISSRGK